MFTGFRGAAGPRPGTVNDQPTAAHPRFEVRAHHTESTVTVYQAYRPGIGRAAARDGRFPPSWSRERMTWVVEPC